MRTIEEIRHANLMAILHEFETLIRDGEPAGTRGAIQRLADKLGKSHSQLSQLITKQTHSKTGKVRNIGSSRMARSIEVAGDKDPGWLDHDHSEEQLTGMVRRILATELQLRRASDDKTGLGAHIATGAHTLGADGEPAPRVAHAKTTSSRK